MTFEIQIDDKVYDNLLHTMKKFRLITGIKPTRNLFIECLLNFALNVFNDDLDIFVENCLKGGE